MAWSDGMGRTRERPQVFSVRTWHHYIGMFIAPALIFLALTGLAQTFNLHEDHVGYTAPRLIAQAGTLHKNQMLEKPETPEPGKPAKPPRIRPVPHYTARQWVLKTYLAVAALGLIFSTVLGVIMSLQSPLRRISGLIALGLGVVVPLLIIFA
ncbi:MAG: hypothetical protein WA840_12530 [Caulobacteraceae bacterium]